MALRKQHYNILYNGLWNSVIYFKTVLLLFFLLLLLLVVVVAVDAAEAVVVVVGFRLQTENVFRMADQMHISMLNNMFINPRK